MNYQLLLLHFYASSKASIYLAYVFHKGQKRMSRGFCLNLNIMALKKVFSFFLKIAALSNFSITSFNFSNISLP